MKKLIAFILIGFGFGHLAAQHQELNEKPNIYKAKKEAKHDSTTILSAFKNGHTSGHFRYFFMATDNAAGLTDYFANAAGGGLRFETESFKGFQFGLSGFYIFNLQSSDLGVLDPTTNQGNRYEIGLFDIENPYNFKDIDRLEEFFLKYSTKNTQITFGRQLINTPFINLQDGRMRPTSVEGIWFDSKISKQLRLEGGWMYAISPRSFTKWYTTGQSVGLYPVGVGLDGSRSEYAEHTSSSGIALLGVNYSPKKWMQIKFWNNYFENVFNTAMLQADFKLLDPNRKDDFFAGIQIIRQDPLNYGGNIDQNKAYFNKNEHANVFGARVGWKNQKFGLSANYTNITADGRYLMPREWGRDPFFTFMPRERNEGFGNVHAFVGKLNYYFSKPKLKTSVAAGYFKLPNVLDFRLNKYGMPAYTQINADIRYTFSGLFTGADIQFLVVGKINNGEIYNNRRYEFNKVNMINYNLVLNYHF